MKLSWFGAAGEVTGSCLAIETERAHLLVDAGLFQGNTLAPRRNRMPLPFEGRHLDAVVLTHAHLDHAGRLPLLARRGVKAPIFATGATLEMAEVLLQDAARIQESDLARRNRKHMRRGEPPEDLLYGVDDVEQVLTQKRAMVYGETREVAPGVTLRFHDAGHILGSASAVLSIAEGGATKTLVCSGDIGSPGSPIVLDPDPPQHGDLLILESTYGDREHRSSQATLEEFETLLRRAMSERKKVLIPAFAVGRTQRLLHHLAEAVEAGRVSEMPVYLDSPLAQRATAVYRRHPELLDADAPRALDARKLRAILPRIHFVEDVAASCALNAISGPCVIIAGAGMCNGGRILHHLKHNLWRADCSVLIVGWQASGTLGAELATGARSVRVLGETIAVRAEVHTLGGFSAHAGQSELIAWATPMIRSGAQVVLAHGEHAARLALAHRLHEAFGVKAVCPRLFDQLEF